MTPNVETTGNKSSNDSPSASKFETYLRHKEREKMANVEYLPSCNIKEKLKSFDEDYYAYKKGAQHTIDFWQQPNIKKRYPELYQLSVLVNAVPVTQVTVERAFSIVAFILSSRRCKLSEKTLNDILLIRLNKQLFEKIICLE